MFPLKLYQLKTMQNYLNNLNMILKEQLAGKIIKQKHQ